MNVLVFLEMSKLEAIVRLYDFRLVAKVSDGHFDKLDGGMRRLFLEREDEAFSTGLVNDGVLVEFIRHCPSIAVFWHVFDIHLPLDTEFGWCIVRLRNIGFGFCFSRFEEVRFSQDPKE